jgi:phage tail-like protein
MTDTIQEPTFLPLNGHLGWRTDSSRDVSVGRDALRLAADQRGPLGLAWRDGSLGGLTLPRGFALDRDGNLYLLAPRRPWMISRFEPSMQAFTPLPGVGGAGQDARLFRWPTNIAVAGRNLYVADTGNRRVQVFDLPTLTLRYVWSVPPVRKPGDRPWLPLDVAAHGTTAYVLDSRNRRVYRHEAGEDELALFVDGADQVGRWNRIAADRAGRVYVLDASDRDRPQLLPYDAGGQREREQGADGKLHEREIDDAGDVRERFDAPAIRLFFDQRGTGRAYFCLPASLRDRCEPRPPESPPRPETPLVLCPPWSGQSDQRHGGLIFDRTSARAQPDRADMVEPALYQAQGEWVSQALDSQIFRCQWHRIELELELLPPGTQIQIHTYSADESGSTLPFSDSPLWQAGYAAEGQLQPPPSGPLALPELAPQPPQPPPGDFLVQSRQGQYLWLKIRLKSDGFGTPTLRGLRLHFPRESYLSYLPAVYSGDDANRWFLERYLSLFQTDWDDLERRIANSIALFDADAVPAGPPLDELASHFGLPLEGGWTGEQRRVLLQGMREFYTRRGTAAGLRAYLQAYLQNMSGLEPAQQRDYPVLVEGWRERQQLQLGAPGEQATGALLRLWSPSVVGRLQLGAYARVGEARLVDTGDPPRDLFQEFAHRFKVYVPAAWVRSAADERMLRRALEAEKPAHAAYELHLVEGRFRVGVQSTIGFDTILGDVPLARLACRNPPALARDAEEPAPSRAPCQRLGYDTVLSCGRAAVASLPVNLERMQV